MKSFSPPPQEISYIPWNTVCELLKRGNLSFVLTSAMENMQPTKAASFLFFLLSSVMRYEVSLSCQNSLFTLKKKKNIYIYITTNKGFTLLCANRLQTQLLPCWRENLITYRFFSKSPQFNPTTVYTAAHITEFHWHLAPWCPSLEW